jgi:hypothetical protein
VERIYRQEVPLQNTVHASTPKVGFREQKIEPSATEELSNLIVAPEIEPILAPQNKSPTPSSSEQNSLSDLRREYLKGAKEYKASLNRLLLLYENNILKAAQRLALSRKLYTEGLVHVSQVDEAALAVITERNKAKETRQKITDSDKRIAAILAESGRNISVNDSSLIGQTPSQLADGRVPVVMRYLQDTLNDPYSMKLLKWSKVQKVYRGDKPYWYVNLRMRAKNGFGAYILKDVGFYVRHNKIIFTENL